MKLSPLAFLIVSLATFRVSHMLALEDGPFDVFKRLRLLLGADYLTTADGDRWLADSVPGKLIICPLCVSVWVGLGLTALWGSSKYTHVAIEALAVSGASVALELGVRK